MKRHATLATAVSMVLACCAPMLAAAQAVPAASAEEFRFQIPSQSLSVALRSFSEVTNLQLVYTAELVKDLNSTAVSGQMPARAALERMLAGTGVAFRFVRERVVTFEKVDGKSDTRVLGPVKVEGEERRLPGATDVNGINGSRDVTATEGTGSYTSNALTIGSKAPLSMKETPQSVSVITAQRMEEQNIFDFDQAMQRATGVTAVKDGNSLQSTYYSRGFAISSIQIDGGAPINANITTSPGTSLSASGNASGYYPIIDMAQYDHVELLRGAAGLFNGYGDPSGSVNLVRKKPLDRAQVRIEGQTGSWNSYRAVLDATSPLGFDGRLRGRAVVSYQDNDFFYADASVNRTSIYGTLEYDLTPSTLINAGVSYARQNAIPWLNGLPRFENGDDLGLPRSTSFVFPWNRADTDTTEIFAKAGQSLGEDWTLNLNLTHNRQESQAKGGSSVRAVHPVTRTGPIMVGNMGEFGSDQLSAEVAVSGAFELFGQRQKVVMGLNRTDSQRGDSANYLALALHSAARPYIPYPGGPAGSPPIDVFNFDPTALIYSEPPDGLPQTRFRQRGDIRSGAYLNVALTAFDRLHLTTGTRYSWYKSHSISDALCTGTETGSAVARCVGKPIGAIRVTSEHVRDGDDVTWPPAISLSYDVSESLTTYLGYTDIFISQADLVDADLNPIDPITGFNLETGLKWQSRSGKLNASFDVFRIDQKNWGLQDTSRVVDGNYWVDNFGNRYFGGVVEGVGSCCYMPRSDQTLRSEGLDLELSGEVLPRWQASIGYTFNRTSRVGDGYGTIEGDSFRTLQPEHLLKVWTSYALRGRRFGDLRLLGGIEARTKAYAQGVACTEFNAPNPATGLSTCRTTVLWDYTQKPYAIFSGSADYAMNQTWSVSLSVDNIFDKRYYTTMGSNASGNYYGAPRGYTLTMRGRF